VPAHFHNLTAVDGAEFSKGVVGPANVHAAAVVVLPDLGVVDGYAGALHDEGVVTAANEEIRSGDRVTCAGWSNATGNRIKRFVTAWTVPPVPATQASLLLYLLNGIEPGNRQPIVQPVLQWDDSGQDGDAQNRIDPFWSISNWIARSKTVSHIAAKFKS
jgi:hypothetical protein